MPRNGTVAGDYTVWFNGEWLSLQEWDNRRRPTTSFVAGVDGKRWRFTRAHCAEYGECWLRSDGVE